MLAGMPCSRWSALCSASAALTGAQRFLTPAHQTLHKSSAAALPALAAEPRTRPAVPEASLQLLHVHSLCTLSCVVSAKRRGLAPCRDFFYKSSNPTVGIILLLFFVFTMSVTLLNCLIGAAPTQMQASCLSNLPVNLPNLSACHLPCPVGLTA